MQHEAIEPVYQEIGQEIRWHRKQISMTQQELGKRVNLSRVSINNIEQGRQRITIHLMQQICTVLCIKVTDVLLDLPSLE